MSRSAGISITPQQFVAQWLTLDHKFQVNIWNFEVKAGRVGAKVFKESFDLGHFNTKGSGSSQWQPRKPRRGDDGHPLLKETLTLKNSIKWKHSVNGKSFWVQIYTDPFAFRLAPRHPGFCYAAVHNAPDSLNTRTGRMANMPQRQFIGHSTVLKDELEKLNCVIFEGFPM